MSLGNNQLWWLQLSLFVFSKVVKYGINVHVMCFVTKMLQGTMILEILFLCFLIFRVIHNACFAQWSTFWRDAKHITVIVVVVVSIHEKL